MKKLTEQEITKALQELEGWTYEDNAIHTSFEFGNFKEAFSVMTRIAFEAEALEHHPTWTNTFNELQITLTTHDADGVTQKDIDMAKTIEDLVDAD